MNDQLKKYVEDNRADFDHLEPSAAIFQKIKGELKNSPKVEKKRVHLMVNYKWLVAASILVIMCITYFIVGNNKTNNQIDKQIVNSKKPFVEQKKELIADNSNYPAKKTVFKTRSSKKSRPKPSLGQLELIDMQTVYANLKDSTSASNRLAAILKIKQSKAINYDVIDNLAKTLNHDSNSNVRLAALDLMSKYAQDNYVANAFLQSLLNQKDPLVQLGLIELLSHTNNPRLDNRLYALANDPNTFSAVKDQAYLVLLNQNKL